MKTEISGLTGNPINLKIQKRKTTKDLIDEVMNLMPEYDYDKGVTFVRNFANWLNHRPETQNQSKSPLKLITEYCKSELSD